MTDLRRKTLWMLVAVLQLGALRARAAEPVALSTEPVAHLDQDQLLVEIGHRMAGNCPANLLQSTLPRIKELTRYQVIVTQQEERGERIGPVTRLLLKHSGQHIYLRVLDGPRKGAQVLYGPPWNDGLAKIHYLGFTLDLDPLGSLMLSGHHHPLDQIGLPALAEKLLAMLRRGAEDGTGSITCSLEGANARLEFSLPWQTTPVHAARGENIHALGRRVQMDPFFILYSNGFKSWQRLREGQQLQVPRYYGTRVVLDIHGPSATPLSLHVYDAMGRLYERYTWSELRVGTLSEQDFDDENPDYGF